MLVGHSTRQGHRRARLRRGKPLRTLYQGESHPQACSSSPEFVQPRRSAPPLRNPPSLALIRLFLSVLGSGCEQALVMLRARSTPPEWPGHGEQHGRTTIHASRGALAILRLSRGHHRVRLVAGSTLVLTPWPGTSPPARSAHRRCPSSLFRWPMGSGHHCQPHGGQVGCRFGSF